ncbi:MAG: hypothetical protein HOF01_05265 [Chloroflexi bacterium]|nr:hypothetical protein [Chloroflexota bacterium]
MFTNSTRDNPTSKSDQKSVEAGLQRSRARIGGLALHIKRDSYEIAKNARAGFDRRFVEEALAINPELDGVALEKKVGLLRRLYFTRLALKSQKKRAKS